MDRHDTLLIACGTPENRAHLRSILSQRYNLLEAANTRQAMLLLEQNMDCIATVILDVTVPEVLDITLMQESNNYNLLKQLPVIVMIRENTPETLMRVFDYGVTDAIPMNYEPYAMLRRIENVVDLHVHKQHLQTMVQEQADILRQSKETMVDALSSIIEYRSAESGQHTLRIRHFTKILLEEVARCCPEYELTDRLISIISGAAVMHDIGKIAIPDAILNKPGKLTPQEWEMMKTHTLTGCQILDTVGDLGDPEYLRYAHNICHYHHERWDGNGYPEGLAGDRIPICAQVVGLADAYDALTSKRVYKDAFSFAKAVNMILKGECGEFSPKLLECFKHVIGAYEALARDYADGLSPKNEIFDTTLPAPSAHREENSLERVRAKYNALVHYIGGLLIEVDLQRDLMHMIYNPYPEMSWMQEVSSFSELVSLIDAQMPDQEGKEQMVSLFRDGVQKFIQQDLRRSGHQIRFWSRNNPDGELFEVTLLRINPIDASRRTMALLCRRLEQGIRSGGTKVPMMSGCTLTSRNDDGLTLIELGDHIPLLAGYTREEIKAQFDNQLLDMVIPEDRSQVRRAFLEQFVKGSAAEVEFRVRNKNGTIRWMLNKSYLNIGTDGQEYISTYLTDITHTKREHDLLSEKLSRYEIILAQTENVLFDWDMVQDTIAFSDTWEKIFGFAPIEGQVRQVIGGESYLHPDDTPMLFDRVARLENGSNYETAEARIATARGRYLWCRFRASAIRDEQGSLRKIVGVIINIDAEKQAERMLQDRAERDTLTKLLNKGAARKQVEEYLSQFSHKANCALLIIDLDNFKQVNDQYGHLFGDAVLTKAAREIEKLFRNQDIVARIGGDEFMVLMRGVSDRKMLESRCQRLLQIFETSFRNQKYKLPLSCSIGISLSPEHGNTYYDLFRRADQALYRAKDSGKNNFFFYDGTEETYSAAKNSRVSLNTPIDSNAEPGLADSGIVRHAFQQLYGSRDTEKSINDILALVGQKMNVSRVYVFENSDDNKFCSNTYEWCNAGIQPEIHGLQNISYEHDIPGFQENFDEQGIFYCPDIAELPQKTYDILAPQGIKSMLQCAIRDNGVFRGYIGFDECKEQRFWTQEQIDTLVYFSELLSLFLLKKREQEKALSQADQLHSILDNQNAWIYIIDPDTCQIQYLNAKCRTLAPDAQPGMACYRVFFDRECRCENCPAAGIRDTRNDSAIIYNSRFGIDATADATLIQWQGKESCLMTCRNR